MIKNNNIYFPYLLGFCYESKQNVPASSLVVLWAAQQDLSGREQQPLSLVGFFCSFQKLLLVVQERAEQGDLICSAHIHT